MFAPSQFLCIPRRRTSSFTGTTKHAHSPPYRKCKLYYLFALFRFIDLIKPNGAENEEEEDDEDEGDDDDEDDDEESDEEYVEEEDDAAHPNPKKRSIDEVADKEAQGSKKIKA